MKRARYLARRSNHVATVSNRGLNVEFALAPIPGDKSGTIFIAMLDCDMMQESLHALTPAILLQKTSWHNDSEFVRIRPDYLLVLLMNRIIAPEDASLGFMRDGLRLPEARPRQLFIPHNLSTTRAPRGILFHPEVKERSVQPKDSLLVEVLSQPAEWLCYDERWPNRRISNVLTPDQNEHDFPEEEWPHIRVKSYVLNFNHSSDLGVTEPTKSTILGSLELEIKQQSGWNSWHVCLITGLEPLPPNPFGTPSLYTVPWYAFETKANVMAGDLDHVLDKEKRRGWHMLLDGKVLGAEFDLESRHSRLFYKVVLKWATSWRENGSLVYLDTQKTQGQENRHDT
ncbi:hypothetical protein V8C42DRAFT_357609 [Trichoderma barbatum]